LPRGARKSVVVEGRNPLAKLVSAWERLAAGPRQRNRMIRRRPWGCWPVSHLRYGARIPLVGGKSMPGRRAGILAGGAESSSSGGAEPKNGWFCRVDQGGQGGHVGQTFLLATSMKGRQQPSWPSCNRSVSWASDGQRRRMLDWELNIGRKSRGRLGLRNWRNASWRYGVGASLLSPADARRAAGQFGRLDREFRRGGLLFIAFAEEPRKIACSVKNAMNVD
jgi:hypothetical protein